VALGIGLVFAVASPPFHTTTFALDHICSYAAILRAAVSSARTSPKSNPDAALIEIIRQHDTLWEEWGRRIANEEEATCVDGLSTRCIELAFEITVTQAHTARGRAGKRRVMRLQELEDNHGFFDWVLARDAERVAAGKPSRKNGADVTEAAAIAG
jgi:hypothetical protein